MVDTRKQHLAIRILLNTRRGSASVGRCVWLPAARQHKANHHLALVPVRSTERELIEVVLQVLRADEVVHASQPALEE